MSTVIKISRMRIKVRRVSKVSRVSAGEKGE